MPLPTLFLCTLSEGQHNFIMKVDPLSRQNHAFYVDEGGMSSGIKNNRHEHYNI